jgi:preprotein translocase subunit SecG
MFCIIVAAVQVLVCVVLILVVLLQSGKGADLAVLPPLILAVPPELVSH